MDVFEEAAQQVEQLHSDPPLGGNSQVASLLSRHQPRRQELPTCIVENIDVGFGVAPSDEFLGGAPRVERVLAQGIGMVGVRDREVETRPKRASVNDADPGERSIAARRR